MKTNVSKISKFIFAFSFVFCLFGSNSAFAVSSLEFSPSTITSSAQTVSIVSCNDNQAPGDDGWFYFFDSDGNFLSNLQCADFDSVLPADFATMQTDLALNVSSGIIKALIIDQSASAGGESCVDGYDICLTDPGCTVYGGLGCTVGTVLTVSFGSSGSGISGLPPLDEETASVWTSLDIAPDEIYLAFKGLVGTSVSFGLWLLSVIWPLVLAVIFIHVFWRILHLYRSSYKGLRGRKKSKK